MIIIIDGYNVLKQIFGNREITEYVRKQFIEQLSKYARSKGHKIIVVFDGGPYDRTYIERNKRITVVYAGLYETADDYIIAYLKKHKDYDIVLVSTDREIGAIASKCAIPVIDAIDFYRLVRDNLKAEKDARSIKPQGEIIKLNLESAHDAGIDNSVEVDELMFKSSGIVFAKSEDTYIEQQDFEKSKFGRDLLHKGLSKEDKLLMRIIKKL